MPLEETSICITTLYSWLIIAYMYLRTSLALATSIVLHFPPGAHVDTEERRRHDVCGCFAHVLPPTVTWRRSLLSNQLWLTQHIGTCVLVALVNHFPQFLF